MIFTIAAVSAIVPSLLIMWYFHARDVYPEPPRVLWATFGLGILTIPAVLLVVLPFSHVTNIDGIANPYLGGFVDAFATAAIPEELFKFAVVYLFCVRHREFDEPMDGIVYGVAASLGFATLENVLYVANGGIGLAVMRALTAVPGHACWGAVMGYFAGQAKFRPAERSKLLALAVVWPITLHGIYDFPLLVMKRQANTTLGGVEQVLSVAGLFLVLVTLITSIVWAYRVAARLRKQQFEHAVATGAGYNPHHPAASALAEEMTPPNKVVSWLMVLVGVVFAGIGGLLTLVVGLSFIAGNVDADEVGAMIGGGVIIGVLPLLVGLALFVLGIRRLNRASRIEQQQRYHYAHGR